MPPERERERATSGVSLPIGALILSEQGPTLMTSLNLISLETPLRNTATLGVRASTCVSVGDTDMQPTRLGKRGCWFRISGVKPETLRLNELPYESIVAGV